ncbi:MAG: YraN family protein [Chloroflexi bacterium]|nr:YraN family protein [Chloroflexota bacterium]
METLSGWKQVIGRWGEKLAAEYLIHRGYALQAANVRTPHGEIDLVARLEDMLVFVEVKTRTSRSWGFPEEAVTSRKQAHMLAAAEHFLSQHPDSPETWQFDVIAVTRRAGQAPEIEHFENVIG